MKYDNIYNEDDRQYLQMMQENICRMASNSANCKTWLITLVSGFFALGGCIKELNTWSFLCVIPVVAFWYLDTFYLQLERKMRNRELDFILKHRNGDNEDEYAETLFNFAPLKKDFLTEKEKKQGFVLTNDRFFSKSIMPFYGSAICIVLVFSIFLNWSCIVKFVNCISFCMSSC